MSNDDFDLNGFMGDLSDSHEVNSTTTEKAPNANWVPEDALANLVEERSLDPSSTNVEVAKRVLEDNAPLAVQRIVHLALYSRSESVGLRASQYLIDKAFESRAQGHSALEQFLNGVEELANDKVKRAG